MTFAKGIGLFAQRRKQICLASCKQTLSTRRLVSASETSLLQEARDPELSKASMDTVVTPLKEFGKNSIRLVKRCTKPDRKGVR